MSSYVLQVCAEKNASYGSFGPLLKPSSASKGPSTRLHPRARVPRDRRAAPAHRCADDAGAQEAVAEDDVLASGDPNTTAAVQC